MSGISLAIFDSPSKVFRCDHQFHEVKNRHTDYIHQYIISLQLFYSSFQ